MFDQAAYRAAGGGTFNGWDDLATDKGRGSPRMRADHEPARIAEPD